MAISKCKAFSLPSGKEIAMLSGKCNSDKSNPKRAKYELRWSRHYLSAVVDKQRLFCSCCFLLSFAYPSNAKSKLWQELEFTFNVIRFNILRLWRRLMVSRGVVDKSERPDIRSTNQFVLDDCPLMTMNQDNWSILRHSTMREDLAKTVEIQGRAQDDAF